MVAIHFDFSVEVKENQHAVKKKKKSRQRTYQTCFSAFQKHKTFPHFIALPLIYFTGISWYIFFVHLYKLCTFSFATRLKLRKIKKIFLCTKKLHLVTDSYLHFELDFDKDDSINYSSAYFYSVNSKHMSSEDTKIDSASTLQQSLTSRMHASPVERKNSL